MDRRVGAGGFDIPAASLSTFDTVSIIALVPVFDQGIYPLLARNGCKLTMLQRMGWGLAVSALAMVAGAAVEYQRRTVALGGDTVPHTDPPAAAMTVFWQTPQYVLIGASEVLASIAQLEFFYDQAPKVMRSCAMALQLLSSALGMYLSAALVWAVQKFTAAQPWLPDDLNEGRLDLYFLLLAALTLFNLMAHVLVSSYYEYAVAELPGMHDAPRPPPPGASQRRSAPTAPISFGPGSLEGDMARSITAMPNTPVIPVNMR
jgi:peptide/histidine transporter 3/4